jgi:hypothetical protein
MICELTISYYFYFADLFRIFPLISISCMSASLPFSIKLIIASFLLLLTPLRPQQMIHELWKVNHQHLVRYTR